MLPQYSAGKSAGPEELGWAAVTGSQRSGQPQSLLVSSQHKYFLGPGPPETQPCPLRAEAGTGGFIMSLEVTRWFSGAPTPSLQLLLSVPLL